MKKRVDWYSLLSYALAIFVAVVLVLHFVFGFQYVVILTDSMKPHINPGDLVVTRPVSPSELHVGDVILYEIHLGNATYRITHRIVAIKRDDSGRIYFVTKGDNRKYTDPWRVYPDQVIGKVILVIPKVGMVWYYTPLIVLLIFLFIIGSLAYEIALILLEEEPPRPKWAKPSLLAIKRKKLKRYYRR
ncbi:signal peptidase I [Thermococcus nautili]|uniref:Signal peptidase I n=1 Tax=Thermococcus nautili TaxID=195522 RepID=W8NW40_9EURY|nr:signal peptidase I [Thermococcus nautili]AHL23508.1 Signal peptidase I [Thermococcus nautili]CAI1492758.1 Signal peptidase I [Thermococcus nautili]